VIAFAALVNCEQPQDYGSDNPVKVPCGECRNCRNILALSYGGLQIAVPIPPHQNKMDIAIDYTNEFIQTKKEEPFKIITASSTTNIPVAIAREIKKNLALKADSTQKRVVFFYQMEYMRGTTADALLKMIEEPPADTVIILSADKTDSLLPTIQSRARKVIVDKIPALKIEQYLLKNYEVTEKRARLISKIAEGSLGRAIDMIEVDNEDNGSKRAVYFLLYKALFLESSANLLASMNEMLNMRDRSEAYDLLRLWQSLMRDCASYNVLQDASDITNIDFQNEIIKLSEKFHKSGLVGALINEIKITLADLRLNVHIQGALMALMLRLKKHINAVK